MQKRIFIILILIMLVIPTTNVLAKSAGADSFLLLNNCNYMLGSLNDETSTAYLLQEIFNIFKFAAPVCVLVFSTVDYIKSVVNQNKEDVVKTTGKTAKRLILAAVLFCLPTLITAVFELIGWTGTCGIG